MRNILLPILFLTCPNALASAYELALNTQQRGGSVSVAPTISAPPGAKLRYEIEARRHGRANSNSRQSGNVTVGSDGTAPLSKLSFSVAPQDRCELAVRVYEGDKLVAARSSDCAR